MSDPVTDERKRNLVNVKPWWRRMWLSMQRDHYSRRAIALAIGGDVCRGLRAKYVRRIP